MKRPGSTFWFAVSLGMTVILAGIVMTYNRRLTDVNLGITGIHSLIGAADPERMLFFWKAHGLLPIARQCLTWDFLFILCYASFLGMLLWKILSLWDRHQLHLLLALVGLFPFPTEKYVLPKRWMRGLLSRRKAVSVLLGVFILIVSCGEEYQIYALVYGTSVLDDTMLSIISFIKWMAIGSILFFSLLSVVYQSAIRWFS